MSVIEDSMDDIQRFIEERERSKKLQFQRQIEDTERVLKEKDIYYRGLIQKIESKSKAIQDLVKGVKAKYINVCSLLKKEHAKTLQQHKTTLSTKFKKFNSDFQKYRQTVNKASCVSMTDVEQQLSDYDVEIPAVPKLPDFNFVENADPINDVSCAFGALRSGRSKQKQEVGMMTREDASTQTEDNGWMLTDELPCSENQTLSISNQASQRDEDNNSVSSFPTENQHNETFTKTENSIASYCLRTVSNFKHKNAFTSLCATVDGAWIAFDRTKEIAFVDQNGNVIKTVVAQNSITNICTSFTSARLWVACSDNRIVEYHENGTTGVVLSVPNRPKCLCITPDNHVVVGSLEHTLQNYGIISVYDTKGVKMNSIKGRQVRPLQMTSHARDTTIAVIHGGHSTRHCVTVYNGHLEPRYTFHGASQSFHPTDLCFHGDGTLFVCDSSCSSILALDTSGKCLTTMSMKSSSKQLLLSIDVNMIWTGYGDSVVKVSQIG